jgi:hypothetical protein
MQVSNNRKRRKTDQPRLFNRVVDQPWALNFNLDSPALSL